MEATPMATYISPNYIYSQGQGRVITGWVHRLAGYIESQNVDYFLALVHLLSNMMLWNSESMLIQIHYPYNIWISLFSQNVFSQLNYSISFLRKMEEVNTLYFRRGI